MALAPWDLVSWHSDSSSISDAVAAMSPGGRRESYLRATRNMASRNASLSFDQKSGNGGGKAKRQQNVAEQDDSFGQQSEIFQTPSGEVSVVITDFSHSENAPNEETVQQDGDPLDQANTSEYGGDNESDLNAESKPIRGPPTSPPEPLRIPRTQPYTSCDIAVLCFVFIFVFSSVRAVQVLQSSVNATGKFGIFTLTVFYLSLAMTVVLIPPLIENRWTAKVTLYSGVILLFFWLGANLAPHPIVLIPAAIAGGAGLTLAWTAQMKVFSLFFTHDLVLVGAAERLRKILSTNNTLFALFQSSHIWGNLSVAIILLVTGEPTSRTKSIDIQVTSASNRSVMMNMTLGPGWYFMPPLFDADVLSSSANKFDGLWSKCWRDEDSFPSGKSWVSIMKFSSFKLLPVPVLWAMVCLVGLGFLAFVAAVLCFRPDPEIVYGNNGGDEDDDDCSLSLDASIQRYIVAHLFQLFDGPHFRLLIPLLFFNGLEQGFLYTDYTRIFVTCMFGLSWVGIAVMMAGVTSCAFSAAASFAAKRSVSREVLISVAAIVHLGLAAFLFMWQAYPSIPILIIVIPVIYGFCDAVWQTACYVLITKVAGRDHHLAFSNFRILQSLGIATSCILSFVSGLGLKLFILGCNLLLAVLCYAILENRIRREELQSKDHERLANAFKNLTVVMGAPGIKSTGMPPMSPKISIDKESDAKSEDAPSGFKTASQEVTMNGIRVSLDGKGPSSNAENEDAV